MKSVILVQIREKIIGNIGIGNSVFVLMEMIAETIINLLFLVLRAV